MAYQTILFEVKDGAARLTLNRPDRLNSFTTQMHGEVIEALASVDGDHSIRALLITGAGRGFCAGQDLADEATKPGSDLGLMLADHYNPLIRRIAELHRPVICAVNGVAAGAGANLALACDIVLAAKSAKFVQSFANIGLVPDSGGTWILPRLIGQARALGWALTGEAITAERAEEWGLVWQIVEDDQLNAAADKLLQRFATGPTQGYAAIKRAIRGTWSHTLNAQLDIERDLQRELGQSGDYREGIEAFAQKRAPKFSGN